MDADPQIRSASLADLKYVISRAKLWTGRLGFMPRRNLQELIERGQGAILEINNERAGYLLWSGGILRAPTLRHVAIEEELWCRGIGTAACKHLAGEVAAHGWSTLTIRTREDIEPQRKINAAIGAQVIGHDEHVGTRGHRVEIWRANL